MLTLPLPPRYVPRDDESEFTEEELREIELEKADLKADIEKGDFP